MSGAVVIVASPQVCDRADVRLAHELMRRHLVCRVDRCTWKAAAYRTLVDAGRLVPPRWSPRERTAARGLAFPPLPGESNGRSEPTTQTIRDVLSKLSALGSPVPTTSAPGSEYGR